MEILDLIEYSDEQRQILNMAEKLGLEVTNISDPKYTDEQVRQQFILDRMNVDCVIDPEDNETVYSRKVQQKLNGKCDIIDKLGLNRDDYENLGLWSAFAKKYNINEHKDVSNQYIKYFASYEQDLEDMTNIIHYYPELIECSLRKLEDTANYHQFFVNMINEYAVNSILQNNYNEKAVEYLYKVLETLPLNDFEHVKNSIQKEQTYTGRVDIMLDKRYELRDRHLLVKNYVNTGIDFRLLPENTTLKDVWDMSKEEKQEYRRLSNEWRNSNIEMTKDLI